MLPIATFPTTAIWDGTKAGNINPSLKYVYKGQSLYKLLAQVDDNKPGSFNVATGEEGLHDPVLLSRRLQAQDLEQADLNGKPGELDRRQDEGRQAAEG